MSFKFHRIVRRIFFLILGLFFISCQGADNKRTFISAGTYVTVISSDSRAAKIVHAEFKRLELILSTYDPASEISLVNNSNGDQCLVSDELIELIELSQKAYNLTDGNFDITKGALYAYWKGYLNKKNIENFPSKEKIDELLILSGFDNLIVNKAENTIRIKKKGLILDLGGIAKGFIVDKAANALKLANIKSATIDAGGDIYCLGKNKNKPWVIGIKKPNSSGDIIDTLSLQDQAVATSGNYEQFFTYKSKRYSHIIDPILGFPLDNGVISVTVRAHNCTSADVFATAFSVAGVAGVKKFIAREKSNLKIYMATEDDQGKKDLYIF